ncbi:MAG: type I-B CRISPR-associated protein Cas7/Cst2/DevR [Bacillota bacterium]|jgi:CRISPR-associated protein Cst2
MSFVAGLMLIDAPAAALNNLGKVEGAMTDNSVGVKYIRTREGAYPYVSAQAYRYWLRQTLEKGDWGWQAAPVFREQKVAYTDANPIRYWDDDLLGYMRAPSGRASAARARAEDAARAVETPTSETVTRVSPLRVSTLVSIAPVRLTTDFGVMARHEGDPVPHEHQFYRTTLQGLVSLDLREAGTFSYQKRSGFLNLDQTRIDEATARGLVELPEQKAYRLPHAERVQRISALLQAMAVVDGGAKQTIHYTDVSPDVLVLAVTRGGNNIFGHIISADAQGQPVVNLAALAEALQVHRDDILSKVYIGWVRGYQDEQRERLEAALAESGQLQEWAEKIVVAHPREVIGDLVQALAQNASWLD